jgi:hypothetical protein
LTSKEFDMNNGKRRLIRAGICLVLCGAYFDPGRAVADDAADREVVAISVKDRVALVQLVAARVAKISEVKDKDSVVKFRDASEKWSPASKDDQKWVDLYRAAARVASSEGLKCKTTVSTATGGARVKFRMVGEATVITAGEPSDCTEDVVIGVYKIWSERDRKPTSSQTDEFRLVEETKKVTLIEDR